MTVLTGTQTKLPALFAATGSAVAADGTTITWTTKNDVLILQGSNTQRLTKRPLAFPGQSQMWSQLTYSRENIPYMTVDVVIDVARALLRHRWVAGNSFLTLDVLAPKNCGRLTAPPKTVGVSISGVTNGKKFSWSGQAATAALGDPSTLAGWPKGLFQSELDATAYFLPALTALQTTSKMSSSPGHILGTDGPPPAPPKTSVPVKKPPTPRPLNDPGTFGVAACPGWAWVGAGLPISALGNVWYNGITSGLRVPDAAWDSSYGLLVGTQTVTAPGWAVAAVGTGDVLLLTGEACYIANNWGELSGDVQYLFDKAMSVVSSLFGSADSPETQPDAGVPAPPDAGVPLSMLGNDYPPDAPDAGPQIAIADVTSPYSSGNPYGPETPDEPSDPSEPVEPGGPIDPVDPTDPIDPIDPSDPEDPSDPADPDDPGGGPTGSGGQGGDVFQSPGPGPKGSKLRTL